MRILSKRQLKEMVLHSPQHVARPEYAGTFPKRIQIGPNRMGWVEAGVLDWLQERRDRREDPDRRSGKGARVAGLCTTPSPHQQRRTSAPASSHWVVRTALDRVGRSAVFRGCGEETGWVAGSGRSRRRAART
jgi:prophage regulatory protein